MSIWQVNHLVVTRLAEHGRPSVFHHPDCYVLERTIHTKDMTWLEAAAANQNIRPCKVCEKFQRHELECPNCAARPSIQKDCGQELPLLVRAKHRETWRYECQNCNTIVNLRR